MNKGIYILKLKDIYLVKICDNIAYIYENGRQCFDIPQKENTIVEFQDAKKFDSYQESVMYAHELFNKNKDRLVYGIQEISLNITGKEFFE